MATQADVRRIARTLPGTKERDGHFAFEVAVKGKLKGYCWVWMERIDPKKARVPNPRVLAVRVQDVGVRQMMIDAEPAKYFTEPHYAGYPAVLVRLNAVRSAELRALLTDGWRLLTTAPRRATAPASPEAASRRSAAPSPRASAPPRGRRTT